MNAAAPLHMTPKEWGMLIGLSVIWGGSFFFVEIALRDVSPFIIVLSRVVIAVIALYIVMRAAGLALPTGWAVWQIFLVLGIINTAVPFTFLAWGQSQITGGLASIMNATTPLFVIVVAHFGTRDERLTPGRIFGVALGFSGVVFMVGPAAADGFSASLMGQLSCLSAPVCYAFGTVYARKLAPLRLAPLQAATGQFMMSALFLIPVVSVIDAPWAIEMPSIETWAALIALGVLSTAVAYLIYFRILSTAGATNILLVTFMVPVTAIVLGVAFLGEHLEAIHFIGMALIGVGLATIDGRPLLKARRFARTWR